MQTHEDRKQKKSEVTTSAMWTLVANLFDRIIGFVSIVILARFLTPHDFGIVAMAGSIVAFADLLNAFGFDWILVRHPEPTSDHYSSAWTLKVILGASATTVLLIVAPISAKLLNQPALFPLISVMSLLIIIPSFENIGIVDFRRNFSFDLEFIVRIFPKIASFIVGVSIAITYHSYWALVLGSLAARIMGTIMSYRMHPFRPYLTLNKSSELLSFSLWFLAGNTTSFMRNCFANLFIGHTFGSSSTGMFALANELAHLAITELAAPINRAVFSKYAKNATQPHLIQEGFLTTASLIWMISFPTALGMYSISNEVVSLILGPQWEEAATILRYLAIGGALTVMSTNTLYVFWALGYTKIVAVLDGIVLLNMVIFSLLLAKPFGLSGVAIAYVIATFLFLPINYLLLFNIAGINIIDLWKQTWRILFASLCMLLILKLMFNDVFISKGIDAILPLTQKIITGMVSYSVLLWILWVVSGRPEGPEIVALGIFKRYWPQKWSLYKQKNKD